MTDLTVIVIGILLALGADAAWDMRVARGEELAYLRALNNDFAQLEVDVEQRLVLYEGWIHDITSLIGARSAGAPADSVVKWVAGGFFAIDQFEAPLGTLDDLVATGGLGMITATEVRAQLAGLLRQLEHFEEIEAELATAQFGHIDPFLIEFGDIGRIGRIHGVGEAVPRATWDSQALLAAPILQNLANLKLFSVVDLIDKLREIAATASSVSALIMGELGQ